MNEYDVTIPTEEEEVTILTLTTEDGEDLELEFLDLIEYDGAQYAVLLPLDGETDEDVDAEVVILQVEDNGEEESYLAVEDEAVLEAVFDIFKENFEDALEFTEE